MRYLIDGYNLLYAMGVLRGRVGPDGLAKARLGLLGLVAAVHAERASEVTVVFDAAGAPTDGVEREIYHGIDVRFAVKHEQADDLIEDLIRHAAVPRKLTVVSDDRRLRQAAGRRGCVPCGCADYLDELDRRRHRKQPKEQPPAEKRENLSESETQAWLEEFADLRDDPRLRHLSDPQSFEDGPRGG